MAERLGHRGAQRGRECGPRLRFHLGPPGRQRARSRSRTGPRTSALSPGSASSTTWETGPVLSYAKDWSRASRFTHRRLRRAHRSPGADRGQRGHGDDVRSAHDGDPRAASSSPGRWAPAVAGCSIGSSVDRGLSLRGSRRTTRQHARERRVRDFNDSQAAAAGWAGAARSRSANTLGAAIDVAYFDYESGPSVGVGTAGLVGTFSGERLVVDRLRRRGIPARSPDGFTVNGLSFNLEVDYDRSREGLDVQRRRDGRSSRRAQV